MSHKVSLLITGLAFAAAVPAAAGDHCTNAPRSDWKPVHEISSHATQLGYSVFEVERDGSCYKIKGFDKNGARVKILYNPQTGEPVKSGLHR